jgi:hypothetical protein
MSLIQGRGVCVCVCVRAHFCLRELDRTRHIHQRLNVRCRQLRTAPHRVFLTIKPPRRINDGGKYAITFARSARTNGIAGGR